MWDTCSRVDPGGPVVIILASGSEIRGFDPGRGRWIFFSDCKRLVDLRYVKEPQAEIRASVQNLSDFSCSMSEATLMT